MIDTAVIMAIGSPSHRSQLTYNRSHTMLPALGKPLVVRTMDRLLRSGIRRYVVILGDDEGGIAAHLHQRWHHRTQIDLVLKSPTQTMAMVLSQVAKKLASPFLIAGYNCFLHGQFPPHLMKHQHFAQDALLLCGAGTSLSTAPNRPWLRLNGNHHITDDNGHRTNADIVCGLAEHKEPPNTPLMLTDFAACGHDFVAYLANLPDGATLADDWAAIVRGYLAANRPALAVRTNWVLQIDTDTDLLTLNRYLLDEKYDAHLLSEIPYHVQINEPVRIDPGVSVGQGTVIGPHVYLEKGAMVGREAVVRNAIVLERGSIPAHQTLENVIVYPRGHIHG